MIVTLLQIPLIWENPVANLEFIEKIWAEKGTQTDLLVLPEMFTTGFSMNPAAHAPKCEKWLEWMQKFSAQHQLTLIGSVMAEQDNQFYNRLWVVQNGKLLTQYDKRHLFRMANEHEIYTAGTNNVTIEIKGWKIRPLICYDLRFPIWSRNRANLEGEMDYDILIYVANWPQRRIAHWEKLLQARAIENQSYVIGVNRVGIDGNEIVYTGSSAVIDALGNPMGNGFLQDEQIATYQLYYEDLQIYRQKFPAWRDAD